MNTARGHALSGSRSGLPLLVRTALAVALLAVTTALHTASPPAACQAQSSPEEELTLRLTALGISVREVELEAAPPRIAYDQAIGEARDTLVLNWLMIFRTALEVAPGLESIRLDMYYLADPSLAITADAQTVLAQDLTQAASGLRIEDLRPPEEAIRQGMALLGIPHASVSSTTETTVIHFVVPPDLEPEAILELWIRAFSLAAYKSPDTPRIVLDLALSDGTTSTVEALTIDVLSLLGGSLEPLTFAATLVVDGGDAALPEPSARGSLPHAAGLAVGGAYFLAAAVLVGGWTIVRLRITLTRLQQAILLASAAGILIIGILIAYLSLFVPPVLP